MTIGKPRNKLLDSECLVYSLRIADLFSVCEMECWTVVLHRMRQHTAEPTAVGSGIILRRSH